MRREAVLPQHYAPIPGRSYVVRDDGRIIVDPAKKDIKPFTLVSEPEEITVPAAVQMCPGIVAGGNVEQPVIFPIDQKGPVEIVYSQFHAFFAAGPQAGQPADNFMVVIFDPEYRPLLMNREVHATTIAGGWGSSLGVGFGSALSSAGGRPFVWPETFFMDPERGGKALFMGFRNLNTQPIKVRWAFHGVRYWHPQPFEEAVKKKELMYGSGRISFPYFYTTDTDVRLAAGASFSFDIRLTDEADVEIFKLMRRADFPFLWRIEEKTGTRFLDSAGAVGVAGAPNGVHSDFGWGDAEFPFFTFESMYYERNFKVKLVLVNALAGQDNTIHATLACRKITYAR
jgi:hypothetical protein